MMNSVTSIHKLDFSRNSTVKGDKSASYDQTSDESDQEENYQPVSDKEERKPLSDTDNSPTYNQSTYSDVASADFDLSGNLNEDEKRDTKTGAQESTDESKV